MTMQKSKAIEIIKFECQECCLDFDGKCDECNKVLKDDETIYCLDDGKEHFCKECGEKE